MGIQRLYPSHIPLGWPEKWLVTVGASVGAFFYPQRADLVAAVGELTGERALQNLRERMQSDPTGKVILQEKPMVAVRYQ
jgi:ubiquinone biosynthesis protein COQ4